MASNRRWVGEFCRAAEADLVGLREVVALRGLRRRTIAAFGHELVELGLVLGEAQTLEKIAEFALFFLKPLERL